MRRERGHAQSRRLTIAVNALTVNPHAIRQFGHRLAVGFVPRQRLGSRDRCGVAIVAQRQALAVDRVHRPARGRHKLMRVISDEDRPRAGQRQSLEEAAERAQRDVDHQDAAHVARGCAANRARVPGSRLQVAARIAEPEIDRRPYRPVTRQRGRVPRPDARIVVILPDRLRHINRTARRINDRTPQHCSRPPLGPRPQRRQRARLPIVPRAAAATCSRPRGCRSRSTRRRVWSRDHPA